MRFRRAGFFFLTIFSTSGIASQITCAQETLQEEWRVLLEGPTPRSLGFDIAVDNHGRPFYKGQPYQSLAATFDTDLQTAYFHSNRGMIPPGSRLAVPTFSGVAADYSHSGTVFNLINILTTQSTSKLFGRLKNDPNYMPVGAYSFDLPYSGATYSKEAFDTLDGSLNWIHRGMTGPYDADTAALKMVPIARSATPGLLSALHQRAPTMMKGMVWTGLMHSADLDVSIEVVEKLAAQGQFTINRPAFDWINALFRLPEMQWPLNQAPLDIPLLILQGSEDLEEKAAGGRKIGLSQFREWERLEPRRIRFIEIQGAGHDVFNSRNPDLVIEAMGYVYRFFQFIENGETDMSAAFPKQK